MNNVAKKETSSELVQTAINPGAQTISMYVCMNGDRAVCIVGLRGWKRPTLSGPLATVLAAAPQAAR